MSREVIELGATPVGEDCAQVGSEGYGIRARSECRVYIEQLGRHAREHGIDLSVVKLFVKSNAHDFGTYYEVAVLFDVSDDKASDVAYWLESNQPEKWDVEASLRLGRIAVTS